MSFERLLNVIKELDPVAAGSVNRPLRQLDQNVKYLWDVLEAASVGATLYARRKSVSADAKVGYAVYLNKATRSFEPGLAVMETGTAGGILRPAPSARIWGVLATKHNATLGDILLAGMDDIDLSQAIDGEVTEGTYYLSGTTPGKMTQQRLPVSVPVLRATGNGEVFVIPTVVDFLDRHVHYRFDLSCEPAGDVTPPTTEDGKHTIDSPDSGARGWLPADHGVFGGKAPAQAVFGYNIVADPDLQAAWPPIPPSQAYLELDRGLDAALGASGVPLGLTGLVIIDRNGIWWTSDCHGDVPWPTDLDSSLTVSASTSDSGGECPRELRMVMTLWFTKPTFATDTSVVTSLTARDARLVITCRGTDDAATAGDLDIDLDLNLTVANGEPGYLAIKEFDPDTAQFKRGPVVEGVYAESDNVILEGETTGTADGTDDSPSLYHGRVKISVLPASILELDTQLIRLDGVEEDFTTDPPLMFLAFRAAEESEIRGRINVPATLALDDPQLKIRLTVLGRAAGTLPALTVTARRLPRPGDDPEDLPLAVAEFIVGIDTEVLLSDTNQYVEVESDAFDVAAGDTVFYTVKRLASDGYAADVGLIRQAGVVTAGE